MCEHCGTDSGVDSQIAYLERVVRDQEKLAARAGNPEPHREALRLARAALEELRRSRESESCVSH